MKAGYYGLSLHGGKDQSDRDQTIADFKNKLRTILVATSVAGRGLDIKDLNLVVNYDCPNHLQAYVHQVGRTGRAGNKGLAYTFITPEEEMYAHDIAKALKKSGKKVPDPLEKMVNAFKVKLLAGKAKLRISGYNTKGYKFDEEEMKKVQQQKKILKQQYESEAGIEAEDEDQVNEEYEEELKRVEEDALRDEDAYREKIAILEDEDSDFEDAKVAAGGKSTAEIEAELAEEAKEREREKEKEKEAEKLALSNVHEDFQAVYNKLLNCAKNSGSGMDSVERAMKCLQDIQTRITDVSGVKQKEFYEEELIINDYPQSARFKAIQTDTRQRIMDMTGCGIVSKGTYIPPNRKASVGEKKLYISFLNTYYVKMNLFFLILLVFHLLIQGDTKYACQRAKNEMIRLLEEATLEVGYDPAYAASF